MKLTSVCSLSPAGTIKHYICVKVPGTHQITCYFSRTTGGAAAQVTLAMLQAQEGPPTPKKALLGPEADREKMSLQTVASASGIYTRSLPLAEHSRLRFRPSHETTALRGPGPGRGWQAAPRFRIAVRGCDLTSSARSKGGLLILNAMWQEGSGLGLRTWLRAEQDLVRPLGRHTPVPCFKVKCRGNSPFQESWGQWMSSELSFLDK